MKQLFGAYEARYDNRSGKFLEHRAGLRLISSQECWVVDLGVSKRVNPDETEVRAARVAGRTRAVREGAVPPVARRDRGSHPRVHGERMKGVILAGGLGTRLHPLTRITNKHLLPIFDRPMIYYPLQALINAGIRDILLVTGGNNAGDFLKLLGNGKDFGLQHLNYTYQEGEGGIAAALVARRAFRRRRARVRGARRQHHRAQLRSVRRRRSSAAGRARASC